MQLICLKLARVCRWVAAAGLLWGDAWVWLAEKLEGGSGGDDQHRNVGS